MHNNVISIIIPIYNRRYCLNRCINSVLNQSNLSVEIILIDDGSTDDSLLICQSYVNSYSNIKLIHQDNEGLSSARNIGLSQITGEYVFFLDSDDYLVDDSLHILLEKIVSCDADYVIGNFERVNETGALISESHMPEAIKNRLLSEDDFWKYAEDDKSYLLFVTVWGKLFKRKIWDTLRFPNVRFAEDEFVLPSIVSQCNRIFVSDRVIYKQTLSDTSLVRSVYSTEKLKVPESKLAVANYLFSRENYSFCLKKFKNAIADICYAAQVIDRRKAKDEFRQIFDSAQSLYSRLCRHVSVLQRLKLFFFSHFPYFYIDLTHILFKWRIK